MVSSAFIDDLMAAIQVCTIDHGACFFPSRNTAVPLASTIFLQLLAFVLMLTRAMNMKIPFVQMLKESIKERSVSHCQIAV